MNKRPYSTFETPAEKAKRLIGLKSSAYKDYLSARILFNNNVLHQACIYTNTCIEKELKAYIIALGLDCKIKHESFKLYNLLSRHRKEVTDQLKPDFIRVVDKIYQSRYYEDLSPGYNFVIVKNKFLAELDYTYSVLEDKVRYKIARLEGVGKTLYEIHKEEKDERLMLNNYLLNNEEKGEYLNKSDLVHEFRVIFNHEIFEASYWIPFNKEKDRFIYEALIPTNNNQSYTISNHHLDICDMMMFRNGELQNRIDI